MKSILLSVLSCCGLILAGCAGRPVLSVPLASSNKHTGWFPAKQYVQVADPNTTPEQGVARIVVLRPGIFGAGSDFKVMLRRGPEIS